MRKIGAGLILLSFLGISHPYAGGFNFAPAYAQESSDAASTREDAEILYDEAINFKKKGNMQQAIDSYARAMRLDRSILASDDHGLIEALKADCLEKLKNNPDDVKTLETLGFVHAVCYSEYEEAIACYERVFNLVKDEKVKDRTQSLIDRLRETASVQQNFKAEVSSRLRDERLKSWSELERAERFGEQASRMQEKSQQLVESYKAKDSLKNRVPQLEKELQDLKDEYDKANRLFYSVSDKDLYERRRRRLKDQIAEKEEEVSGAKEELREVEETASVLEREISAAQKKEDESPIRSYDDRSTNDDEPPTQTKSDPGNESGDSYPSDDQDQPLPAVENPDFPDQIDEEPSTGPDASKIDELIDNL